TLAVAAWTPKLTWVTVTGEVMPCSGSENTRYQLFSRVTPVVVSAHATELAAAIVVSVVCCNVVATGAASGGGASAPASCASDPSTSGGVLSSTGSPSYPAPAQPAEIAKMGNHRIPLEL